MDVIEVTLPYVLRPETSLSRVPIDTIEGCTNNDNYYTSGPSRSTCCCSCAVY